MTTVGLPLVRSLMKMLGTATAALENERARVTPAAARNLLSWNLGHLLRKKHRRAMGYPYFLRYFGISRLVKHIPCPKRNPVAQQAPGMHPGIFHK